MTMASPDRIWAREPSTLAAPRGRAVHVWRLPIPRHLEPQSHERLAPDEQRIAGRIRIDADRNRFTATRSALRVLLGRYLGVQPAEILFAFNEFGKPSLAAGRYSASLNFNVAHSGDYALLAFCASAQIGVDVEHIEERDAEKVAKRILSKFEYGRFLSLPEAERKAAFFRAWTRKEAMVKAVGNGLSLPLDRFDVGLASSGAELVIHEVPPLGDASEWSLCSLAIDNGYAGALAVRTPDILVCQWDWG